MSKIIMLLVVVAVALIFFRKKKAVEPAKEEKEEIKAVEMKQDPVCGSYVEETTPYKVKYYDKIYYFCSEECKDKFIEQKKEENQA